MKLPSLLPSPKYKRFEYQPRYYDPIKEDIKRRVQSAKHSASGHARSDISGALRRRTDSTRIVFNLRFLIVVFLICDFLLFFYTDNNYLFIIAIILQVIIIYLIIKKKI